ncbi:hypothetical protein MJ1HA_0170 [Metallosphaera sedula]|nr:hypothetical protein MJ1HA_0170 [Metallosphaera sedula]
MVFGKQGNGKTTYSLITAKEVYEKLGHENPWQTALDRLYFELPECIPLLKQAFNERQKIPVIIFDDASIWFSKYYWYTDIQKAFFKIYALIRTLVTAVIFTTPSPNDISFFLREKSWKKIKIAKNGVETKGQKKGVRRARAWLYKSDFERNSSGDFKTSVKREAVDDFYLEIPQDILNIYMEKRRKSIERLLTDIEKILENLPEEPPTTA